MEFACSHVVCNWKPKPQARLSEQGECATVSFLDVPGVGRRSLQCQPTERLFSRASRDYDNRIAVIPKGPDRPLCGAAESLLPPPIPPRQKSRLERSWSPHPAPTPSHPRIPPPLPPRTSQRRTGCLNVDVNVVSVNVGRLVDLKNIAVPVGSSPSLQCRRCSAAVSQLSNIDHNQGGSDWSCEFCSQHNRFDSSSSASLMPSHDVLYLHEDADGDYVNLEDLLVVFCVDISGSMCVTAEVEISNAINKPVHVSRLQSIQDAIQRSLNFLLQTCPRGRVALVTFNDEVTVYGDGTGIPLMLKEWELMDFDFLMSQGQQFTCPRCVEESIDTLRCRVQEMREHGSTALGPAALVSIAMASRYSGSKVIICTDGLANTGLGYIDDACQSSSYFYRNLANEAAEKGVIVSVLTFEGTDCRLAEVGRLADRTGGRVNIVNINNVSSEIQSVLEDNVIATNVKATFLIAEGMYFKYEDHSHHRLVKEIGNVTEDLEITFQFGIKESSLQNFLERDKVPFQLQLDFKTRDLQRATRILSLEKSVAPDSSLVKDSLNVAVLGVHCAQLTARLTMDGRVREAHKEVLAQRELLQDMGERNQEEDVYENWIHTMAVICDDLSSTPQSQSREGEKKSLGSTMKVLSDEVANVVYRFKRANSIMLKKKGQ
ncbi:circularly permutated Ras protein 1 [Acipenser ruthenus]|uniref:circularly permutated Ras protein 1 n=1 Tax=Acipenser ruthenus TaxID=7906 RepID=UPI00145A83B4|nr:circularly permutated Ras protein 1 [Acipenser ruthenus]